MAKTRFDTVILVVAAQRPQGVGHRASSVRHDRCVAGVGLRLPGVQASDAAHRQARQLADIDALSAGDGERQRFDRRGLVDDEQHPAVRLQRGDQLDQLRFVLGESPITQRQPRRVERGGVMRRPPTSTPTNTSMGTSSFRLMPMLPFDHRSEVGRGYGNKSRHPRCGGLENRSCPYQRPPATRNSPATPQNR